MVCSRLAGYGAGSLRFSIEILRKALDGSSEVIHRMTMEAVAPKRVKATAVRELDGWTSRGATSVAIYNQSFQKLYEWSAGEELPL
jgi:hypothetical protein